ncbi:hypothetical protein MMA231_04268 (plasmid) [Asticcacaulis sp. MM231]|uniref:hypothetical protein n=1 Tax=Asticcacaulis sp. MM231 TaxID=3157666 RepID=UPI0032D59FF7
MSSTEERWRRELNADEKLLWSGTPIQGLRFHQSDFLLVPFSLMWGGFAFFWEASVLYSSGVRVSVSPPYITGTFFSFMALWGIPFCLVGLYVIFGRFFFDAAARANTVYAVTDRRIIIVARTSVRSLAFGTLPQLELKEGSNGRGSIIFGESSFFMGAGWPAWGNRRYSRPMTFDGISKVREVYTLIIDAAHKVSGR